MKIWVYLNGNQQGPYTLDELSQMPISASTPVWYDGLPQWMPAGEAPVTAGLFARPAQDRPLHSHNDATAISADASLHSAPTREADGPACPPTYIGLGIFILLCRFPIGGIFSLLLSSMTSRSYDDGDYPRALRLSQYNEWVIMLSFAIAGLWMPLAFILL